MASEEEATPDMAGSAAEAAPEQDRIPHFPENHGGEAPATAVRWKSHLDMYHDLRAVQFASPEQFAAAARLLWTEGLRELPYDLVGNRTVIVPAEAVSYFRPLAFTETEVLCPDELPPEELARLRSEMGPY